MPYNRVHVRGFLAKTEIDLFESSLGPDLKAMGESELKRRIARTRKLRDKNRDLLRRQKLATRARTGSKLGQRGDANVRTAKKAAAFDEALSRFEAQAAQVAAKAAKATKAAKGAKTAQAAKRAPATAAKGKAASSKSSAASKRKTVSRPAAVVLREALQKKQQALEAGHTGGPQAARPVQRRGTAVANDVGPTPPDVRATIVASKMQESNLSHIQGHTSTQVRKAQAKRDDRH